MGDKVILVVHSNAREGVGSVGKKLEDIYLHLSLEAKFWD